MPSLAEIWMERGKENELYESIKMGLEIKFKQISEKLFVSIQNITEMDKLKEIQKALYMINDADEFKKFVQKHQ